LPSTGDRRDPCTYGVLCFSKTWENPVIWSHYADRHRGIALGFDINSAMAKEVTYTETRPPFCKADEPTLPTLLYTKHRDWQYEQEVRVYARLEERDATTGLYFGDFNENMVLREIITGPLCATTKGERSKPHCAMNGSRSPKGVLPFNTFNVVTNKRGFSRTCL
jgi:hypothetical protein